MEQLGLTRVDPTWAFRMCLSPVYSESDLDMDVVQDFIRAMRRQQWDEERNAINPIVITPWGTVRNGRHRLAAIAATGVARPMYVNWEG